LCGAVFHKIYILTAMAAAGSTQQHPRPPPAHIPPNPSTAHEHLYPVRSTITVQLGKCKKGMQSNAGDRRQEKV
ncbi:MAG: hypothetical protein K8R06_06375, partial [Methanosarcinales archaeon]|nr:hypothetical protein [Methanosarcinales archaeon]